jgi:alpha-galactosidase/6-phospho-beta-glucosidase family protein
VEAAVNGDREAAFEAMLLHPLMPNATGCKKLLDELLEINRPHLAVYIFLSNVNQPAHCNPNTQGEPQ